MPSMYEIYQNHSEEYDELVSFEDYKGNLRSFLDRHLKKNMTVLELGTGTGRVTKMYINEVKEAVCCDKYNHMLIRAEENLKSYADKIKFLQLDTRDLEMINSGFDLIIEGWALGHTVIDEFTRIDEYLTHFFDTVFSKLKKDGIFIFIETLGTNVPEPKVPLTELEYFYDIIETKYLMKRTVIETDYKFPSIEDAIRILTFFFGDQIKEETK